MSKGISIETPRLVLRHWQDSDAEALFKYASDPEVSTPAQWPCHTSVEMSRMVIKEVFAPNPLCFAIVLRQTNEAVGCIGLVPQGEENFPPEAEEREVGYWICRPLWNKGLVAEALRALMQYLHASQSCRSLMITTKADNTASQRVAAKCGFVHVADFEQDGVECKAFRELRIERTENDKRDYMPLLLIGDESEPMIMKYLDRGELYAGTLGGRTVAVVVTTENSDGTVEVKNLAVDPDFRRRGIGRLMLAHVEALHPDR